MAGARVYALISGAGKISINFLCCREMMPDPEFYRHCLEESWAELEKAIVGGKSRKERRCKSA